MKSLLCEKQRQSSLMPRFNHSVSRESTLGATRRPLGGRSEPLRDTTSLLVDTVFTPDTGIITFPPFVPRTSVKPVQNSAYAHAQAHALADID